MKRISLHGQNRKNAILQENGEIKSAILQENGHIKNAILVRDIIWPTGIFLRTIDIPLPKEVCCE